METFGNFKKKRVLANWVIDPEPNNPESELRIPIWSRGTAGQLATLILELLLREKGRERGSDNAATLFFVCFMGFTFGSDLWLVLLLIIGLLAFKVFHHKE
ncbi:hypothetical protein GH714_002944 [Hevea brasiliensis]|uniref:Uncharacterized protein n=1 Tax=Hevea brasiliensis TaxID=3981 RepID=A0A6A6KI71_HEVBR|nr:hypothetical protein GH714_002944 [Hevea brasiliensis]